jgi:UDP-N-acetylglucosamine--N-acetylmuramyl-(pentapeptide) pyrophosphoryl-undecaprenol N-acetylglucosamine transferase
MQGQRFLVYNWEGDMKTVLFTGGGTAGHITPNIAIIEELKSKGYGIEYIGMRISMEEELITKLHIPFHRISGGKLRRYFDLKNLTDLVRIIIGFIQSLFLIKKIRPAIVFSKGGFVSCPVVWAAWVEGVPVVIHESDMTPGLANRLSIPFCKAVCCSFPETLDYLPSKKGFHTGLPVRKQMLNGDKSAGLQFCGFDDSKPIIVVTGGSQGAERINKEVRKVLFGLLVDYHICHICGKGNVNASLNHIDGYKQFEFVSDELPNIFAMADLIVSRAGATTIFEILALRKLNILIPLSKKASRGDQVLNAHSFERSGYSLVVSEDDDINLIGTIDQAFKLKDSFYEKMCIEFVDANQNVIGVIEKLLKT